MNTYATKPSDIERKWYVVDAEGVVLGRLAAEVSKILRGKHKPSYVPNLDCGDYVIVINADKVKLTGKNWPIKFITDIPVMPAVLKKLRPVKFWKAVSRVVLLRKPLNV